MAVEFENYLIIKNNIPMKHGKIIGNILPIGIFKKQFSRENIFVPADFSKLFYGSFFSGSFYEWTFSSLTRFN